MGRGKREEEVSGGREGDGVGSREKVKGRRGDEGEKKGRGKGTEKRGKGGRGSGELGGRMGKVRKRALEVGSPFACPTSRAATRRPARGRSVLPSPSPGSPYR